MRNNEPIGFIDSGIGGITMLNESLHILPHERYIYIGDTANVPYGDKSPKEIKTLAISLARRLLIRNIKALVLACNTISAIAYSDIQTIAYPIPVIDVIRPTVESIPKTTGTIAVIGTQATIDTHIYKTMIRQQTNRRVIEQATPTLVPLIEQSLHDIGRIQQAIRENLEFLRSESTIDTLILGCTHYPLIKHHIQNYAGDAITIIDSSRPTALTLKHVLEEKQLLGNLKQSIEITFTKQLSSKTKTFINAYLTLT